MALATTSGDSVLHGRANYYLGIGYQAQGDYHQAIDCFKQTVASFEGPRRRERFGETSPPAVLSRVRLAWCHAELGTFAEGKVLGDEGLRITEAVDHPGSLMFACNGAGLLALRQGDLPRALPLLARAVGLCHEADFPAYFSRIAVALGVAYTLGGRVTDAVPLLTQAMEQSTETGAYYEAICGLSLGEAHLLAGHIEEAYALAERTLALTRAHQEMTFWLPQAEAALAQGGAAPAPQAG